MTTRERGVVKVASIISIAVAMLASGCLDRELKPLNPCLVSGVSRQINVRNIDKIDLLFMVDNSNSMAGEQVSLKQQFPNVIKVLTSGDRFAGDPNPFPPAKDLHVGVVSSDMGTPGFTLGTSCFADGGPDNGKLRNVPAAGAMGCAGPYPTWLSYVNTVNGTPEGQTQFANDVSCIATLGTGGCGFEQQLEAPFKALWPSIYRDPNTGNVVTPNPVTFLTGTGLGDIPPANGGNLGFLRNSAVEGLSLIAIVVVTDEEDCSVSTTEHLRPNNLLMPPKDAHEQELLTVDLNLRCFRYPQNSWPVLERYLQGFRRLRPGTDNLVVFAAITGVPKELVSTLPDFNDEAARTRFYDTVLSDSRMIQKPDPSITQVGQGNLAPSCSYTTSTGENSTAFPPVRIVELAKGFGPYGIVQSICQEDFGPAMGAIINIIANQLGQVCLPRKLVRQADGEVSCNVVWELPPPNTVVASTPVSCSQAPGYLGPVDTGRSTTNSAGGQNCKVLQLPVGNKVVPTTDGWYYDDFSPDLARSCKTQMQRIAFAGAANPPPTGVVVKLECLNETQRLAETRTNVAPNQAEIGTPCGADISGATLTGDAACVINFADGSAPDTRMFCHPDFNTCVRQCVSSTECPPAWVCDDRGATLMSTGNRGYCVNPTCNVDSTKGGAGSGM